MKILVIDDNESITKLLYNYLKMKKYDCVFTNDPVNGLNLIRQQDFDTVLLDIGMPEMSGFEVLENLEKNLGSVTC